MIVQQTESKASAVQCPLCDSEAVYKYGKSKTGKQRFLCLMCGRQFTFGTRRHEAQGKPDCPACGKPMHIYKMDGGIIRFRCADYPRCRTFRKYLLIEA